MACMATGLSGCGERDRGPEVVSLEGKIEDIKPSGKATGEITVVYYSEKHKQDVPGTAIVNKDTEILINGTLAELSQLKKGERVRGDVLVERRGEEKVYTVRKMYVDRPIPPLGEPPPGAEPPKAGG